MLDSFDTTPNSTPLDTSSADIAAENNSSAGTTSATTEKPAKNSKKAETTPKEPEKEAPKLKYATDQLANIQAVVGERFRFPDKETALTRLDKIRKEYEVQLDEFHHETDPHLVLWIRGFALETAEKNKGYLGNFAKISIKKLDEEILTLTAIKIEVDLSDHPVRGQGKRKHPNWGHPILRRIKKDFTVDSIEEARLTLAQLHYEFPEISIPASDDKLHIIVYSRQENPPIQKVILETKLLEDGIRAKIVVKERGKKRGGGGLSQAAQMAAISSSIER